MFDLFKAHSRLNQQVEVDVDHHLALDQQFGIEGKRVDGGVDRPLDHVLYCREPVVDLPCFDCFQHFDYGAEPHMGHLHEIGLGV